MKKFILNIDGQEYWKYAPTLDEVLSKEDELSAWVENKELIKEAESDILNDEEILKLSELRFEKIKKIKNTDFNSVTSVKNIIPILKDLIELL